MTQDMTLRIAIAQINLHVGAIEANQCHVIDIIQSLNSKHVDLIVFPELTLTSYPPEDLLLRAELYHQIDEALDAICKEVNDVYVVVGYPKRVDDKLFNACSVIYQQNIIHTYYKQRLPNYGVFDEKRYFDADNQNCVFTLKDVPVALSICEDIWFSGPSEKAKQAGAELIININASPFHLTKQQQRRQMLTNRAKDCELDIIYTNLVGGQDDLIFDGCSMAINRQGEIDFEAEAFNEDCYLIEYHPQQHQFEHRYSLHLIDDRFELIYKALLLGIKDYVSKNGFNGVILGLSGGIDSALTLALASDALGPDQVEVFLLPSKYTSDMSNVDAIQQATTMGVKHHILPIEKPYNAFLETLESWLSSSSEHDTTEENIQARCRGTLLMAISNKFGQLLLTTGNKSEMAVGYATLYGDMAGGFAPLKDVPKLMVYELANWRNQSSEVIPQRVIDRPPSAELRPDQKDEDSLPHYEILDPILERYIEQDINPEKIIAEGFSEEDVRHVVRLVDRNEYKRRQSAPGIRITKRAFGRDRRYPITSGYREK